MGQVRLSWSNSNSSSCGYVIQCMYVCMYVGKTECSKLLLAALIGTLNSDGSSSEESGTYIHT